MKRDIYLAALWVASGSVFALEEYPSDFADFFTERRENVELFIHGEQALVTLKADVTYDNFKLVADKNNQNSLSQYLLDQGLRPASVNAIVADLLRGVEANPNCKQPLPECIPEDKPNVAEYVYDFDAGIIKVFISSEMLETQAADREYHKGTRVGNALVNWSELYVYHDQQSNQVTWNNRALLGLPLGYVTLDTQYSTSQEKFLVRNALYDLEQEDTRTLIGYQDQSLRSFNSADLLNYGGDYSGYSATYGSSDKLVKGNSAQIPDIRFFAPQAGQLEIFRGEELLLTKVIQAGQQSISYSELPTGVYTINLTLRQGSATLLQEQRQVVNVSRFSLATGDWDYQVAAGYLDDNTDEFENINIPNQDNSSRLYARASAAYRPYEQVLLATGLMVGDRDVGVQFGGDILLTEDLNVNYNTSVFNTGAWYYYANVNYNIFHVSVEQNRGYNLRPTFAQELYGNDDMTQWSIGASGSLLGGTGFLNYFHSKQRATIYDIDTQLLTTSDNLSFSWSRDLLGGVFGLSLSYAFNKDRPDLWTSNISWSRDFSSFLSGRAGVYFDQDGYASNIDSLTFRHQDENWSAASTLGVKFTRDAPDAEFSSNVYGRNDYMQYSGYGYLNQDGDYSLSGTISGNQIVSPSNVVLTSERAESFVAVKPTYTGDIAKDKVTYDMQQNGQTWYRDNLDVDEYKILPLKTYQDVQFDINAEAYNIDIKNHKYDAFVLPATYHQLDAKLTPLSSKLFVFKDISGESVTQVKCIGEGCRSLEQITQDGVFRLNYLQGEPFKLLSDKRLCVYSEKDFTKSYVNASCLPGLDEIERINLSFNKKGSNFDDGLIYVGKYEKSQAVNQLLTRLKSVNLASHKVNVGDETYVYVQYKEFYSTSQRALLENLDAYVTYDEVNPAQLFSVR